MVIVEHVSGKRAFEDVPVGVFDLFLFCLVLLLLFSGAISF